MTPVGARCRGCARLRAHPVYDVRPLHYLRAIGAGLAVATVGAYVVGFIPFIGLFGLMLLGWAVGEAVTYAANRKRGTGLAIVAVATLVVGALAVPVLATLANVPPAVPLDVRASLAVGRAAAQLFSPWGLFLALAAVIAVSRVR
jgi:hypothetical protein